MVRFELHGYAKFPDKRRVVKMSFTSGMFF